ncbi:MAG: glycosyltransferase [Clostridia bacterium]|nr:glycosyltransferase [Clostridia bacterium]
MKILHVNCLDTGSTGKIISSISRFMALEKHESVLCAATCLGEEKSFLKCYRTSLPKEQGIYRRISFLLGLRYGFAPFSTRRILRIIKNERPDVVHLHSINCNMVNIYALLRFLKHRSIPTVVTNHAEFLYTGSCSHAGECTGFLANCGNCPHLFEAAESKLFDRTATAHEKMKIAFDGFDRLAIVSVSPWVKERASASSIMKSLSHRVILNGVDTDVFCPRSAKYSDEHYGIPAGAKVVFHATASFTDRKGDPKGGEHVLAMARRFASQNVVFLVAGRHSISNELPKNVRLLGEIRDQEELAGLYSRADLTLVTSFRETFSMPVAESLCCGTPVVGFCAGGPESIALSAFSAFCPFGDEEALYGLTESWLPFKSTDRAGSIVSAAVEYYSSERMAKEYYELYQSLKKE